MGYDYQKFWNVFGDAAWYNPSQRHRFRLILREVEGLLESSTAGKPFRLLDLGCGKGHLIVLLQQKFPSLQCSGIDISESAIASLKEKVPQVEWKAGDIQKPLPQNEAFDLVICSEVLEHCEQVSPILDNIAALTKPGGFILITLPGGTRYRIDETLGHLRHYTLEQVRGIFGTRPGLKVVKAFSWGFPFLNLMRWMTHLFHGYVVQDFLDKPYSFRQKAVCEFLYRLMFIHVPGSGIQRFVLFQKK